MAANAMAYQMCLLKVPDQTSSALERLLTQLTIEFWWVRLHAQDKVVLHPINRGALEFTFLEGGGGGGRMRRGKEKRGWENRGEEEEERDGGESSCSLWPA